MPSEEGFHQLHKNAPVMFHSVDCNGRLVDVSNFWLQVMGYQRDEVIGRKSTDFLTEASRRYAEEVVLPEFFRTGFCTDVPYQIVTKSGQILDVLLSATAERDSTGEVVRSLAVLTDVTGMRRTEKALQDAETIFSKAFRSSATILLITKLADGRFIEVNDSFERSLGYQRSEAMAGEISWLHIWDSQEERARYLQLIQDQGEVHDLEVKLRTKSGVIVVGLLSGEILDFNGEKCLLSQINDITERKRTAQEVEVLHTDLAARAYELEIANQELEAFSYTVSHDLRKPLTTISGYCQVILDLCSTRLDSQCQDFIHEILNGTTRMNELIDTLLEYSRATYSKVVREDVDLSQLATEVALELEISEPQRQVTFRIEQGMSDQGDSKLLRVVLENLLGNAWKYSAHNPEACIEFGSKKMKEKRVYFIRDNGIGFEESSAAGLFTAFKRLPGAEHFKGFGVGLATVERIIKSHGGRIWAEGEKGKGATFYFTVS